MPVLSLIGIILFSGCRRPQENGPADIPARAEEVSGYGITLREESPPQEVARLLITGLDNRNEELLKKLVAVKYAREEIDRIFSKHGRKSNTTDEQAAVFAVDGWIMTYSFFINGQTGITSTTVDGDNAAVIATGKNRATGKSRKIKINLRREGGWWKAEHGINTM